MVHFSPKPNKLVRFIANNPKAGALIPLTIMVLLTVIGLGLAPIDFSSDGSWAVRTDIRVERNDVFSELKLSKSESPEQTSTFGIIVYYFHKERDFIPLVGDEPDEKSSDSGESLFTETLLTTINDKVENKIVDSNDYNKFCLKVGNSSTCSSYARTSVFTIIFPPDGTGSYVGDSQMISDLSVDNETQLYSLGKNWKEGKNRDVLRSQFIFGIPNKDTDRESRNKEFSDWAVKNILPILTDTFSKEDTVQMAYIGSGITEAVLQSAFLNDVSLIFGGIVLVGLIILGHTRSTFLTLCAMVHIMLSFGAAQFIFFVLSPLNVFPSICGMSIYVVLGIGADDVFLFFDAWRQSHIAGALVNENLETKLQYAWKRSSEAMLITTITTVAAFGSAAASPIPTIALFGGFTAVMLIFNYIYVITWFPAIVVLYHTRGWEFVQGFRCNKPTPDVHPILTVDGPLTEGDFSADLSLPSFTYMCLDSTDIHSDIVKRSSHQLGKIERFYYLQFSPWIIKHHKTVIVIFGVLLIGMIVAASFFDVPEKQESGLPVHDPTNYAILLDSYAFSAGADSLYAMDLSFVLGVDFKNPIKREKSNGDFLDPNSNLILGTPQFTDFDLLPTANQLTAFNAFQEFENDTSVTTPKESYNCSLTEFKIWWENEMGGTFPVPSNQLYQALWDFTHNTSYIVNEEQVGLRYEPTFGFNTEDNKIDWMYCSQFTSIENVPPTPSDLATWYKNSEKFQDNSLNPILEDGNMKKGFVTSFGFVWLAITQELSQSAIQNILISISLAFVVVLLMTHSLTLGVICVFTLIGIVTFLLGWMVILGYNLDIIESIVLTIAVGLSVDYSLHILIGYQEIDKPCASRSERVRYSLLTIGVSIFAGYATTMSSLIFLLLGKFTFFFKFGVLGLSILTFSFLFSHLFLVPLLLIFGPQNDKLTYSQIHKRFEKRDLSIGGFEEGLKTQPPDSHFAPGSGDTDTDDIKKPNDSSKTDPAPPNDVEESTNVEIEMIPV